MTKSEYEAIKKTLEDRFREGMAALEMLYAVTNGTQPEPDLGPPPVLDDPNPGLQDATLGTVERGGKRKYRHSEAWQKKHRGE